MTRLATIAAAAALLLFPSAAAASPERGVLVRFGPRLSAADRHALRERARASVEEVLPLPRLQLLRPAAGTSADQAVARLERSPDVLYAEPDRVRIAAARPNDSLFGVEWGFDNTGQSAGGGSGTPDADIDAPEAWNVTTGSSAVTVGVADSGIDTGHPDLSPNVWSNPGETGAGRESNGADDDGNGLVDDAHGWDWVDGDATPSDSTGHGTHTAGIVGARGNDALGVAGVTWTSRLAPLRVLGSGGTTLVSRLINAYGYARAKGFRVVNGSLGSGGFSQAEHDAIAAADRTLFVFAVGNSSVDNDTNPTYPCSYDLPNVLCVAASDGDDGLASFSGYGDASVDLAAPGERIVSTWAASQCGSVTPPCWAYSDGTSNSAPLVAGVAALLWARNPAASVATVRHSILSTVDRKAGLAGKTTTGGRLNAFRAVSAEGSGSSLSAVGDVVGSPSPAPRRRVVRRADLVAPSVTLRLARRHDLRAALRRGLLLRIRCSEACALRAELLVGRKTASHVGLSARRYVQVGRGRASGKQAGWTRLRIRLSRRARRALRRLHGVRTRLRVRARDHARNRRVLSRRLVLR